MYRALSAVLLALILGLSLAACDVAGTDPEATEFTWHAEDLPALGADFSDWGLEDVQMVSATEGWAVGWKFNEQAGDGGSDEPLVLRYDGTWQEEDISDLALSGSDLGLLGVGVAPNGDVWAVGGVAGESLVLVRHNGSWSRINEPVGEGDVWPDFLEDVAFADEHNTYVAAREGGTGRVLRFVDRAYVEFFATDGELRGIDWGDQGYAVGDESGEGDIAAVRESSEGSFDTNLIAALDIEGHLWGVDVLSGGDGFAVGYQSGGDFDDPLILQHSGGSWTEVAAPVTATDADNFLTGVSLVSSVGGWAVGYFGDFGEPSEGILLRYLNGDWTDQSADIAGLVSSGSWGLNAVSALPTVETWAVGTDNPNAVGIILRYGP